MKMNGVKVFTGIVTLCVIAVIVLGFVMAGSPNSARARNADQNRVDSLQQITGALDNYWNANKALPHNLEELSSGQNSYVQSINDPKTGEVYGYSVVSGMSYELCADFETVGNQQGGYSSGPAKPVISGPYDKLMNHGIGHQCFVFNINNWSGPTVK